MRARMFRDDLERIVDEIENSEVMWRGISDGVHGYDEIDTDEVTVRSEVARLTRLYERAVRLNGMNNPDMYMAGAGGFDANPNGGVRPSRGGPYPSLTLPTVTAPPAQQPAGENLGPVVPVVPVPEDAAPATRVIQKDDKKESLEETKSEGQGLPINVESPNKDKAVEPPAAQTDVNSSATPTAAGPPSPAVPGQLVQAVVPQAAAPLITLTEDPDASPATAIHLKIKKQKSATESGMDGSEGKDVPKPRGVLDT